jgi:hypothetical protein
MIQVDLASSSGHASANGDSTQPNKKPRLDQAVAAAAKQALPWDRARPLSLAKVEEERRALEQAQSTQAAEAARIKAEQQQRDFQAQYQEQLRKQESAAVAAAAAAAAASFSAQLAQDAAGEAEASIEEQTVRVGGRLVALSSVTQEEIDTMTPEEFEEYSRHAAMHDEF